MTINKNTIKNIIPYLGLIIVIIPFTILSSGKLIAPNNIQLIFEQCIMIMISSTGVLFVMTMGGLDFSQGGILGITCIVAASAAKVNIPLSIVLTLAAGIGIGCANGLLHTRMRMPSFIVTICTMVILRGLTIFLTREEAIQVPFELYDYDTLWVKIPILAAVLVGAFFLFRYTKFGKACRAIGAGEKAAAYSGIHVNKVKVMAFALAGFFAAVAAYLTVIRVGTATANTGQLLETNVLIALVLGGLPVSGGARSKFSSVVIGAVLLAILTNGLVLIGVDTTTQQLIKGIVFLVVVAGTMDRKSGLVSK